MNINALLEWAQYEGRNPPWRATNDLYKLAVAEILLQKTQAANVVDVWVELVARFPTPSQLHFAGAKEIMEIVKPLGLGNQRTVRLTDMAKSWVDLGTIGARLSGLGSYGNGVVRLAAGMDPDYPPIDGNVARVVTRYYGLAFERGESRKKAAVKSIIENLFNTLEGPACKLRFLYGLVDLGAVVCRPSKPSCHSCPFEPGCAFPRG